MKDLKYYGQKSLELTRPIKNLECALNLEVNGETWRAYEVNIAHQDLLFFCDKGTANYLVDRYCGQVWVELFNWETN